MGVSHFGSKIMVEGSLSLMKFPFQVIMDQCTRWEGSSRNWILTRQWMRGFRCWVDIKVHKRK